MTGGHDGSTDAALIRYDVSDGVCVLRLDSPPVNAITYALLEELRDALCRAGSNGSVRGIVIAGDARHFSAGADVNLFREINCAEDAVRTSRVFQEAFQEVEDSAKPVAAAVSGKVMGSALELAMACHFRVCTRPTRFSMPEVDLGINPGAGGTGRLPRLVGPGGALKMLLTGKAVGADDALAMGLVDAVCEGDELIERARELLLSAQAPLRTGERSDKVEDGAVNDAAFREAEKLVSSARPEIIAPSVIARAVRVGLEDSFRAGLLEEQKAFAECMATRATRSKIYLFFATRGMSKWGHDGIPLQESGDTTVSRCKDPETLPAEDVGEARSRRVPTLPGGRWRGALASCPHADVEPAKVAKAAVVGMGSMGTGIAHALMIAGVPAVVLDEDESALRKGMARIEKSVGKRVEQGKLTPERRRAMLGLVSTTTEWREIADADLVIEAVFENPDLKRSVIGCIENVCAADAVIATNTSTISLDALAEGMRHPERLVGMHFFNPAHRMPLVEVVRRDATSGDVIATALAFARTLRKTPVLVRNREGFLVNRIFVPYLKEAFRLLEAGADPPAIDRAMIEFGFPMGPLALIDMAGLDILAQTDDVMCRAFPAHGKLSRIARRLVELGHLGQKTGSGVYRYEKGDYTPRPSDVTVGVVADVMRESGRLSAAAQAGTPRNVGQDEITERLVLRMVGEAFAVMEEGVAQREADIDAATVLGIGFPDFRGGLLRYARDVGLDVVLARLDELAGRFGERFAPCALLRASAGDERS